MRKKKSSPAERIRIADRRAEVMRLLKSGMHYREIALTITANPFYETCSIGTVFNDVKAILAEFRRQAVMLYTEKVLLEEARLDEVLKAIWPRCMNGDLGAIDRFLKISERRSKLLALDADQYHIPTSLLMNMPEEFLEAIIEGKKLSPEFLGMFEKPTKLIN